jgi:BRCT domain type II-containing protein
VSSTPSTRPIASPSIASFALPGCSSMSSCKSCSSADRLTLISHSRVEGRASADRRREETRSSNEELQSLNKELEISKEEIESSNKELVTVKAVRLANQRRRPAHRPRPAQPAAGP